MPLVSAIGVFEGPQCQNSVLVRVEMPETKILPQKKLCHQRLFMHTCVEFDSDQKTVSKRCSIDEFWGINKLFSYMLSRQFLV